MGRVGSSAETKLNQEAKRRAKGVGTRSEGAWKALENQGKKVKHSHGVQDVTPAYKAARSYSGVSPEEAARAAKKHGTIPETVASIKRHHPGTVQINRKAKKSK